MKIFDPLVFNFFNPDWLLRIHCGHQPMGRGL